MAGTKDPRGKLAKKIGIVVPYESRSAIAWYANRLQRCFSNETVHIFTEKNAEARSYDEACVACWDRTSDDLSELEHVIETKNIDVLHVLAFRPFFKGPAFTAFVARQRQAGRRVLVELADIESFDQNLLPAFQAANAVLTRDPGVSLDLISFGVKRDQIRMLPSCALQGIATSSAAEARTELGFPPNDSAVLTFVDGLASENFAALVSAIRTARGAGSKLRLFVAPIEAVSNADGFDYRGERLEQLRRQLAADTFVHIPQRWFSLDDLPKLVRSADAVAFAEATPDFTVTQALAAALHARRPVIAPSIHPFLGHSGRVLYVSNRLPLASAISAAIGRPELRETLCSAAGIWAEKNGLEDYLAKLTEIYSESTEQTSAGRAPARIDAATSSSKVAVQRTPRILMQCRDNVYTQPGGDTIVMDRISEGLRARGVTVDIDARNEKNPRDYDLVHLYNFAIREQTELYAKRCAQLGIPYVVTTLYEDWPLFASQMQAHCSALEAYINSGQDSSKWAELLASAKNVRPSPIWDNSLTANGAASLIATGQNEAQALRRDYPAAKQIEICPLAADFSDFEDGGKLFREQTGLSDFVLCVGRFELRKNQLMLLKALEESELTVVFAGGGFSYQPAYLEACKRFKRKGRTVFLDRLEPNMLASAFQAARVHALPGWLELPGLVSLEAAHFGTNVVITDFGTSRDYLGDFGFYCHPGEPQSIFNAVQAAFYSPVKAGMREQAKQFTWDKTSLRSGEIYKQVLSNRGSFDWSFLHESRLAPRKPETTAAEGIRGASIEAQAAGRTVELIPVVIGEASDGPKKTAQARELCEEGDKLAKSRDFEAAKQSYKAAIQTAPNFARGYRSCGALALNEQSFPEAEEFFRKALQVDSDDSRSTIGLASVRWELDAKEEAFQLFLRAARKDPSDGLAVLHLVRTGYALNRLKDLEQVLRAFLKTDPDNINILYCLAGCSYKRDRLFLAQGVVERLLKLQPDHADALELKKRIQEKQLAVRNAARPSEPAIPAPTVDDKLRQIEVDKRNRDFAAMLTATDEVLADKTATPSQLSFAKIFRAEALGCTGKLAEADAIFEELESNPALAPRAIAGRGALIAAGSNFARAKEFFERSLRLEPNYDVALAGMGLVASQNQQLEEAWEYFQRALASNPENLRALYGVVQLGYEMKRLPETAKALEAYLDLHPVDLAMNYSYAGCLYALNRKEEAIAEIRKILLFDANHRLSLELLEKIESEDRQKVAHAG